MFNLRDKLKLPDGATLMSKLATRFGNYQRQYPLDFQLVVYFKVPLAVVTPYVPDGLRAYHLDAEHGAFYITMMHVTGGSVGTPPGLGFDEILWGIRVQSVARKPLQSWSLVTGRLMTSAPEAQTFLATEDRYLVHTSKARLAFEVDGRKFNAKTVDSAGGEHDICRFDLGSTPLVEDRWAFLPGQAEVFKPPYEVGAPLRRYDFTYLGLMQFLQPHEVARDATFEVWPHPLFEVPFPGMPPGKTATLVEGVTPKDGRRLLDVAEVNISKPGAGGVQLLSRSVDYRPKPSK